MVGGSGDRLWPLSRKKYPKQFNKLISKNSLFQETALRFKKNKIIDFDDPIILTNNEYRFIINEQLKEIKVTPKLIILEPLKKNTSPAILAASLFEKNSKNLLLLVPSDHYIENKNLFLDDLAYALKKFKNDYLSIFGIKPDRVETGYGYIKILDNEKSRLKTFESFIEKPDNKNAKIFYKKGNYLWNSGLILFDPIFLISLFGKYDKITLDNTEKAILYGEKDLNFFRLNEKNWNKCKNISIDYAILEKIKSIKVIMANFIWDDLGDWQSVWKNKSKHGLVKIGNIVDFNSENSLFYSLSNDQVLATIGVDNVIVVSMDDAVLVVNKNQTQKVKEVVKKLKLKKYKQAEDHNTDYRPWGTFKNLISEENFKVKKISVAPGESLSLQKHKYRSENWVIVEGKAKITLNKKIIYKNVGEAIYIPKGAIHRLENDTKNKLVIIEVQTGEYFGEDDIIRLEDKYSR